MANKFDVDQIRAFWTQQVREHGQSHAASWSDRMVIELEIREIARRLEDGDRVLDVGCANGYSTMRYARQKAIDIRGVDYIPEMVDQARARLAAHAQPLASRVEFSIGDAMALDEPSGVYDKAIVTRVIINLGTWERQRHALRECARVIKTGGLLLLSEATLQGWTQLNSFRAEWALPPIPMPVFNHYLDEDQVTDALHDEMHLVELVNFASTYYVGTRVLKPLLAQASADNVNVADPDMHWNRWFASLPAWGDYGTQKLFVFRRK